MFNRLHCPGVLILFLIFIWSQTFQTVSAQGLLDIPVSFSCNDCTVSKALKNLGDSVHIVFSFSDNLLKDLPNVTFRVGPTPIKKIIKKITKGVKAEPIELNGAISISFESPEYTLSGTLRDKQSGETLTAATVMFFCGDKLVDHVLSSDQGYFSRELPPNTYLIKISYPGYGTYSEEIIVNGPKLHNIPMEANANLKAVTITDSLALRYKDVLFTDGRTVLLGVDPKPVTPKMPGGDIAYVIAQIPGVLSGVDGLGGLHIRGGNADQNLFILDDVPVYNPSHSLGLISIFNTGIIKSAGLWKGDFPARYSGRASSVVDIRTRDGNMYTVSGGVNFNAFSTSAYLEGPIRKDKSSFLLSVRRTFFGPLIQVASKKNNVLNADFRDLGYYFYDINAKYHQRIGANDRLYISYYRGRDAFKAPVTQRTDAGGAGVYYDTINLQSNWGNAILALRWNHVYSDKIYANTTLSYSTFHYNSQLNLTTDNILPGRGPRRITNYIQVYNTNIRDQAIRHDVTWQKNNNLEFRGGFSSIAHRSNPGTFSINFQIPGQTEDIIDSLENGLLKNSRLLAYEVEGYMSMDWKFLRFFHTTLGVNASRFFINSTRHNAVLPRLRLHFIPPGSGLNLWTSYNFMAQYMHQIGSFNIGLPFELWVPSTAKVKPERVRQFSAGASWGNKDWAVSTEGYVKYLDRVLVLLSVSESIISGSNEDTNGWEDRIISGNGFSKGIEMMAERKSGKVRGKIIYTLSKTDRQYEALNNGKPFPFQFDRRHDMKGNISRTMNKWWDISVTCNYISGNPITLAGVKYTHQIPDPDIPQKPREVYVYSQINGYRLPWIKRWDLAFNINLESHLYEFRQRHRVQFGIYNIFNRKNPFYQVLNVNSSKSQNAVQYTLLPFMPFLNYEMTF